MQVQRKSLHFIRIAADIGALLFSFIIAAYSSAVAHYFVFDISHYFLLISLIVVMFFTGRYNGIYDEFRSRNFVFELIAVIKTVLMQTVAAVIIIFLIKEIDLSRQFVLYFAINLLLLMGLEKYILRQMLHVIRKRGRNSRNILIIGAGKVGRKFYDSIRNNPHFGYRLVGFLDDERKPFLNGSYLGSIDCLQEVLEERRVDDVIVALPNYASEKVESVLNMCERYPTRVRIIPDFFKFAPNRYSVSMFGQFPILSLRDDQLNLIHWRVLKRTFDLAITLAAFILLFSWLWPVIVVLQKIFNPGPVFYKATRWGRDGEEFLCYKFRSMVPESKNVDDKGKHNFTNKNDKRITKFGRFLRKTNLDELPQFINVLKGEMSLVGPRPHDVYENIALKEQINSYMWRHVCKPGITGWAAVNGFRGGTSNIELMQKRTDYDTWYIENWTFWLDVQILFLTVRNMIKGDPNAY